MGDLRNNTLVQFAVVVLAVTAGQLLLKMAVSYLPDQGVFGATKKVVGSL